MYVSVCWCSHDNTLSRFVSGNQLADLNLHGEDLERIEKDLLNGPVVLYPKLPDNPYRLFIVTADSPEVGYEIIYKHIDDVWLTK